LKKVIVYFLIFVPLISLSQVPKKVVVEHFTNTVCSACAANNPDLYNILNQHPEVMHIAFYPSSPYSTCLFNQQNSSENDARTNHYGIYGATPRIVIQGQEQSLNVDFADATILTNHLAQPTPISIKMSQIKYGTDSIKVEIVMKAESNNSLGNGILLSGVAEDTVFYSSPNGETEHYDVFRKSTESINGVSISIPSYIGDSIVYSKTINSDSHWEMDHIFSFALLQTNNNELIQAEYLKADGSQSPSSSIVFNSSKETQFFPNPSTGIVTVIVENSQTATFTIYNNVGKQITVKTIYGADTFDLSNLPKGTYILQIEIDGDKNFEKLILH